MGLELVHLFIMMSSSAYTTIFFFFLIVSPILSAPENKAVEDRTFCIANAPTTCASMCANVDCNETCTVVCGFLPLPSHLFQRGFNNMHYNNGESVVRYVSLTLAV